MNYPTRRPRRLRLNSVIRGMVEENHLEIKNFIYPLFVVEGKEIKKEIPSMPGQHQFSLDKLSYEIQEISKLQIPAVLLFGIPSYKDETGSEAWNPDGIIQKAIKIIKKENPELLVITDVCLCEYTSHGHCGVIEKNGMVNNDKTLDLLAREAVSHADAGADMIAPSDMMDGRVGRIRTELDSRGFQNIPILAYSVKYASAFYGPFREAAESTPQFGDRKGYQMNPANSREAVLESDLDIEEGADILMVKPALAYMDVIQKIKEKFNLPLACYNVSGEYAMVKAAAQKGWIDEKRVVLEILTGLKRAGADLIISYHAKEAAVWLKEGTANLKFEQKPDRSELKPVKIKV